MTSDRKAKLKALAARAGRIREPCNDGVNNVNDEQTEGSAATTKKTIVFRNYAPTDESIIQQQQQQQQQQDQPSSSPLHKKQKTKLTKAAHTGENDTSRNIVSSEVVEAVSSSTALQNALKEARQESTSSHGDTMHTVSTTSTVKDMAPKKINSDLKRDISAKLAKLEKRTQKAIVSMLRERLELEASAAVNEEAEDDVDIDLD